jgi:CHAT domain-containing protein
LVADYTSAVKQGLNARQQARDLYIALLQPVVPVESKSHYVVIPDGCLNLLPFDALIDQHDRYVVQSRVVSYAPSSTTLFLLRSKEWVAKRPEALLAVGGVPYSHSGVKGKLIEPSNGLDRDFEDLPNSELEAKVATSAFKNSENEELRGTDATESNLKRALSEGFGYVHLAVHAVSSDNPDRASLVVLSDPSRGEDGFVQASEIVQMHLSARVVILSACETDVGPIEGEEGISALSTSFLLAGVRTVVSTLWPVEDQSSLALMKAFYEHLGAGQSVADSLAAAKRDVLSRYGANSLPIHWAGFVVQGSEPGRTVQAGL